MPFCVSCGHENADTARFCNSCGQQLPTAPTESQPAYREILQRQSNTPKWNREAKQGCLIILFVIGVLVIIALVVVALCVPEDIPEEERVRREAEKATREASESATKVAENATKEAAKAFEQQTKEAGKSAEQQTKEAVKAIEESTKEARKSLDQQRKDADLPSCTHDEDEVIRRANYFIDTFGDIKSLEDQRIERVDVDDVVPSVTCSAKGNLDNVFDGYTFIRYEWSRGTDGRLWVSAEYDARRARAEATKEARER